MEEVFEVYVIYFPIEGKYLNVNQPKDAVTMTKNITQTRMFHSRSHYQNQLKILKQKGYKGFVEIKTLLNY